MNRQEKVTGESEKRAREKERAAAQDRNREIMLVGFKRSQGCFPGVKDELKGDKRRKGNKTSENNLAKMSMSSATRARGCP